MADPRGAAAAFGPGLPLAFGLLAAMEAGVPVPIPIDLVVIAIGERVAAGSLAPVVAVVAVELVALAGTVSLFLLARGPGRGIVTRLGPRVGLSQARISRATSLLERHGSAALVTGRATPGLRTVTVVAAGTTGMATRRAVPWLLAGSSVFLQAHLLLGYALGPVVHALVERALVPALLAMAALVIVGIGLWIARRGRHAGLRGWSEGTCPACLAVGLVVANGAETEPVVAPGDRMRGGSGRA
ncbi:MAG TPA: VTT domain-containing protein [Nitriliruptorales bacterium]|nr:VTT domain-containing protein [Nitriliruptorales bacterium]